MNVRLPRMRLSRFDHLAMLGLLLGALLLAGKGWLDAHPEHNPWTPLDLRDPPGWATARKLAALRDDPGVCRAVLDRSGIAFTALDPAGEESCARPDRTVLPDYPLRPTSPPTTCSVAASLHMWLDRAQQSARATMGSPIARIDHLGAYSCRRLYGRGSGPWSEHATGNAIDIAGFVLEDGTQISVLRDWNEDGEKAAFLRSVREDACGIFGTVLSPDYNAAHRDHFHLDQAPRGFGGVCR